MPNENLPLFADIPLPAIPARDNDGNSIQCQCPCCETEIDIDNSVEHNGFPHCQDCISMCENCNATTTDVDNFYLSHTATYSRVSAANTQLLCENCNWECTDCSRRFSNDVSVSNNASGEDICESCAESYYSCDDCRSIIHEDNSHHTDDGTYCQSCYESQESEDSYIYNHEYKPRAQFLRGKGEKVKPVHSTLFLGVELEVDIPRNSSQYRYRSQSDDVKSVGLAAHPALYCKEDGSLNRGFEMVSHPATWQYWQEFDWTFLRKLKKMGYRSYDANTCGLHVHASRSQYSKLDILKLLTFFKTNRDFVFQLSRRGYGDMAQWASIAVENQSQLISMVQSERRSHNSRYTAINLNNSHTVEFRLFRGTMKPMAINRNIAFVVAITAFVKENGLADMRAGKFCAWMQLRGRYVVGKAHSDSLIDWLLPMLRDKSIQYGAEVA